MLHSNTEWIFMPMYSNMHFFGENWDKNNPWWNFDCHKIFMEDAIEDERDVAMWKGYLYLDSTMKSVN